MSSELFTSGGQRKYLNEDEHARFLAAATALERAEVRTLCATLAYTGCRITEALELTADRVDLSSRAVTFRSLKKRGKTHYRTVPVPDAYLDTLELVHGLRRAQKAKGAGVEVRLWSWGRTQATKHVWAVMKAAGIEGPQASPKGLRHAFGVRLAMKTRNPRLVQKMLGHASLETTAIYMDVVGGEARDEMALTW